MSQQDGSKADSRERRRFEPGRAERRGVWLGVRLPFLVVLAVVAAIIGMALSLRSPVQVALLSDSMLTALALVPLSICLFPLVILSLGLVALLSRWQPKSRSPLRRLEALDGADGAKRRGLARQCGRPRIELGGAAGATARIAGDLRPAKSGIK